MTIESITDQIDALLPQTHCTQCGYDDCLAYAHAIADDRADINQCPPGGDANIVMLARLLNRAPKPLNPTHGIHKPKQLARIDEPRCIGCVRCIKVCPVDAIVGTAKQMHTIIVNECTGCELCVPVCPTDCILLTPAPDESTAHRQQRADIARLRRRAHLARMSTAAGAPDEGSLLEIPTPQEPPSLDARRAAIDAALQRARAKRTTRTTTHLKKV